LKNNIERFSRKVVWMDYKIIPLVLSKYTGEKGIMTFLKDYGTPIVRPFIMWYIAGLEKNVLIDTGIDASDYKNYHPKFKDIAIDSIMTFEEALQSIHLTPEKIDIVIQTHLHFDHCHNTRKCVNAQILVQEDELNFAMDPVPFEGIYRKDLFTGLNIRVIKGDLELFPGIQLLLVPGHSAGGQAVCIQTEKGKVVISGLCGIEENFFPRSPSPMAGNENTILPGIMLDALKAFKSINRMRDIADIILPLHEPKILDLKSIP